MLFNANIMEGNQNHANDTWFHAVMEVLWENCLIKYKGIIKQCLADLYPLTIEERNYGMGSLKDNDLNIKGSKKLR